MAVASLVSYVTPLQNCNLVFAIYCNSKKTYSIKTATLQSLYFVHTNHYFGAFNHFPLSLSLCVCVCPSKIPGCQGGNTSLSLFLHIHYVTHSNRPGGRQINQNTHACTQTPARVRASLRRACTYSAGYNRQGSEPGAECGRSEEHTSELQSR